MTIWAPNSKLRPTFLCCWVAGWMDVFSLWPSCFITWCVLAPSLDFIHVSREKRGWNEWKNGEGKFMVWCYEGSSFWGLFFKRRSSIFLESPLAIDSRGDVCWQKFSLKAWKAKGKVKSLVFFCSKNVKSGQAKSSIS